MTPERWGEMERLYHLARERGPAVLSGSDPDLRRAVEKLLAQDGTGRILDHGPADVLAEMTFDRLNMGEALHREGQAISHYEIRERLGAGGMGVVYKAFDTKLQRWVALKFLPHAFRDDPELKQMLMEEARAASALDHPNIVVIYEVGEVGEDLFLSMALHEGDTLRTRIDGPLPVQEALLIARQVASGLARAHEHGIFHRDIKPSNLVVAKDGVVRIIDFGLARPANAGDPLEDGIRGTPLYMSPEHLAGKPIDFRTDIWSLGVVLYEMLAGTTPFRSKFLPELVRAVTQDPPPELGKIRPGLPAGWNRSYRGRSRRTPASDTNQPQRWRRTSIGRSHGWRHPRLARGSVRLTLWPASFFCSRQVSRCGSTRLRRNSSGCGSRPSRRSRDCRKATRRSRPIASCSRPRRFYRAIRNWSGCGRI
jgi:serine/threonine protein kinase